MLWIQNENMLNTVGTKYKNYGKKKKLLIRNLTQKDSGVYECAMPSNITQKGRAELWGENYYVGRAGIGAYSYSLINYGNCSPS